MITELIRPPFITEVIQSHVVLLLIMLVVLGVGAYNNLPKESYPEVEQSSVYVGTPYPGNSPTDIENLITRPIEKELNSTFC
mgnify:CR=1 FL=1